MRLSRYLLPVAKEAPSDAQIVSHKLMLRAGLVRQTASGIYAWLPLGLRVLNKIEAIVRAGIPVMAHIGFTPQSEHGLGGHLIQGRGEGAQALLDDARAVEEAGAFAVVLEMVPSAVAEQVTQQLSIPTISVGAGPHCDGQLMVWTDWAGFTTGRIPKFVKQFATIGETLHSAALAYRAEVDSGAYPSPEHEYTD